jgi:hypothetical protein
LEQRGEQIDGQRGKLVLREYRRSDGRLSLLVVVVKLVSLVGRGLAFASLCLSVLEYLGRYH